MKKQNLTIVASLFGLALVFFGCKKETTQEDLCDGIICINGGNCVNGSCNCPPQWTGSDCSQEKAPIKMKAGKVEITSFPPTDANGAGWDTFDGADVYITISKGGANLYESGFVEDLQSNYTWSPNFEFTEPTATYTIEVWDYDDGLTADDYMGGIQFTPYQPGQKFPETITLDCGNCVVSFSLTEVAYFH